MKARALAILILLTLATNASAQLYKYVGADGKVVYADRPPVAPIPNVQVFSAGVPRAVRSEERGAVTSPKSETAVDATPARHSDTATARTAATGTAGAAADAHANEVAPLLPALRVALGETVLIDRTVDLCISTLPKAYKRYVGAQDAWKARNAAVTNRMNTVLSDLVSAEGRLQLEQEAIAHTVERLQAVRAAPPAKRIAWCEQTADEIGSGKFDLAGNAGVQPLLRPPVR